MLTFAVDEAAAVGNYPITVSYYKGRNGNYTDGRDVNFNQNDVALGLRYVAGSVEVYDCKPGDVNNDNTINIKDSILLAQYFAEWDVELNLFGADCNGDGTVNIKDAILLAQYLAEWDVTLGKQ